MGDTLLVNATRGLNLRVAPALGSEDILLLEYGHEVEIKSDPTKEEKIEVGGMLGNWVEVHANQQQGYVFDAYLTKLPVVYANDSTQDPFISVLEKYAFEGLGVVDTTYYENGSMGEGTHQMTIFQLQGGHQYIEHSYWEAYAYELQLQQIRDCEGILLLLSLLRICNKSSQELEKKLMRLTKHQASVRHGVELEESCCKMSVTNHKNFTIKLTSEY